MNIAATVNLTGILLILLGTPQAAAIANAFVMIVLLLLLCEITPKTVAVTAPVAASTRLIEPCLTPWVRIVAPLRALIRLASDRATALVLGREERRENILSADDFAFYLRDVEREGIVSRGERRLILNLIEASSTPVSTIMVPARRCISSMQTCRSTPFSSSSARCVTAACRSTASSATT